MQSLLVQEFNRIHSVNNWISRNSDRWIRIKVKGASRLIYLYICTAIKREGDNILAILQAFTAEKIYHNDSEKVRGLFFEAASS